MWYDDGGFLVTLKLGEISSTLDRALRKEHPVRRELFSGVMFFDVADFCDFCYEHYDYKMDEIVEKNGILEHAILWKNDFTSAWNWEGRSRKGYETQFEIQTNDDLEDNLDKYCKNRNESTMCYHFIFEQSKYVCKPKYELVPNLFPDIIQQYANHCVERGIFFSCYLERKKGFALLITTENSGNEESETESNENDTESEEEVPEENIKKIIDERKAVKTIDEGFTIYCDISKFTNFLTECDIELSKSDYAIPTWFLLSEEDFDNGKFQRINLFEVMQGEYAPTKINYKKLPKYCIAPKKGETISKTEFCIYLHQYAYSKNIKLKKDMLKNFLFTALKKFNKDGDFLMVETMVDRTKNKPVYYCSLCFKDGKPILLNEKEKNKIVKY